MVGCASSWEHRQPNVTQMFDSNFFVGWLHIGSGHLDSSYIYCWKHVVPIAVKLTMVKMYWSVALSVEGFYRALRQEPVHFGQIGGHSHVSYVSWYECGIPIPGKWWTDWVPLRRIAPPPTSWAGENPPGAPPKPTSELPHFTQCCKIMDRTFMSGN